MFVDPFLVFKETAGPWSTAHAEIVAHFNRAFVLIAQGNRNPAPLAYRKDADISTRSTVQHARSGHCLGPVVGTEEPLAIEVDEVIRSVRAPHLRLPRDVG